jgi:hypothetical protein
MAKEVPVVSALHDGAATSLLLGSIGILALVNLGNGLVSLVARDEGKNPVAYLSPYRWNHKVASVVAVTDETVEGVSCLRLSTKKRVRRTRELPRRP